MNVTADDEALGTIGKLEAFHGPGPFSPPQTVSLLLDHAIGLGASDLFLSAAEDALVVSLRHLGVVRTLGRLDTEYGRHCLAHLRTEAGLDIAEHRRPLDGRWTHQTAGGKTVDLRVCSLPTLHGEDLSVRILDREVSARSFDQLGLAPTDHERLSGLLNCPGGLILVTGPTGSGKTTTLYACLRYLNNGLRRIHTIEDPIEYDLSGIHQSQPNAKLGLHFPDVLRGIIRQGPDVIMIGEIRDAETAATAVSAANSGHLVLATLHAPVAAGGIAAMLAHGVAPHFLATSLLGIVSQRLVRTFCPECRFPVEGEWVCKDPLTPRYSALGCPVCHQTGFGARTALFEILVVSRTIRELIRAREPAQLIEEQAYREGMTGFLHAAQALVARGRTDMTEVQRCIPPDCLRGEEPST
jgi:type II secretory ATPase GspE/PulE/Tfp pilus assembly ATPase PilB-like protein